MPTQGPEPGNDTLFEASYRLVGRQQANLKTVSHLLYPSVEVDLTAIDSALSHHIPSLQVEQRLQGGKAGSSHDAGAEQVPGWMQLPVSLLKVGRRALSWLPGPWSWPSLDVSSPQLLSWNANQPLLAVGHSSSGAVLVFNCTSAAAGASSTPLQQPEHVLVHQLQQQASSVAWRPVHSSMLAVGCAGGVALWNLGKLPLSAAAMSRGADGAPSAAAAWTTFLWFKANCRVSCLDWSPDGMRLAGSSIDCGRLMVWDVALGVGCCLGQAPVHLLRWSPDGNYLFGADRSGSFFLFETTTWGMRKFVSPAGSAVSGCAWAPDSSVLLLSSTGSNYLVGVHLVGQPSKLVEQLLPVALPGVSDRELTDDLPGPTDKSTSSTSCISSIAWDPTGNRLAVVLKPPHASAGTVALYSTTTSPVVSCNLVGYVNPGMPTASEESDGEAAGSGDRDSGEAKRTGKLQAVFAPVSGRAEAAALLSVGLQSSSGELCRVANVPMFY